MNEHKAAAAAGELHADETPTDVAQTGCCIVGGGPAGVVLALLLARAGIDVTLLEAHHDFDRDFRGDTIHPSTLEVLDQLGLADKLHEFPHGKLRALRIVTPAGTRTMAEFRRIKTRFPYVMLLPQAQLLTFLAAEAGKSSHFHLVFGANVQRLVERDGAVQGVRYRGADDRWHEVRAALVVACDGRFSKVRSLAGLEPVKNSHSIDVIWCRLSRRPGDPEDEGAFHIHGGHMAVLLSRADHWQIGYVIVKGDFQKLRASDIDVLRQSLAALVPWLADRVGELADWKQVAVLSVESSRLTCWHKPGLLLIGDAAHVMTPVGGVGINCAIQDAVEAANLLAVPLRQGRVAESDLAAIQRLRERPTRVIQALQRFMQRMIINNALAGDRPFRLPLAARIFTKLPVIRDIPVRLLAFGLHRVRVKL
jgi:2-polyprenyl-6-methoxyphenol hydroxylase-like FAD-dependent oxidoreductase